jgi:hypothetical protein
MFNEVMVLFPKKRPYNSVRLKTGNITEYGSCCFASRITSVLLPLKVTVHPTEVFTPTSTTDYIDYANQKDLHLAVISLDHATAYDFVEHLYIYHVLQKFVLGITFT